VVRQGACFPDFRFDKKGRSRQGKGYWHEIRWGKTVQHLFTVSLKERRACGFELGIGFGLVCYRPDTGEIEVPYHECMTSVKDPKIHRSLTPDRAFAVTFSLLHAFSSSLLYAAVMALRTSRPRCLEFNRRSMFSGPFWTISAPSVRMSSMWEGFDMYGLI
jgi:hypothetical protein